MKKIILSLCLLVQVMTAQNNYGEFTYPHSAASILSSGLTSIFAGQPGFVMAGYNPNGAPFNFTIDRTDMGGAFTGSSYEFQKEYTIFADVSGACALPNCTPITTSHGVSIIQTSIASISSRYAVVGAFDEGMYFAFLDFAGTAITNNTFWFPFPAGTNPSTITKPLIKEDALNPGNYFICGSYDNIMYAMGIDYNGALAWSKIYAIDGHPNDMIASGSDMIIVGQTTTLSAVPDGFVCRLLGTTAAAGNVTYFNIFDNGGYYQNFSCVAPTSTPSAGFVVGGSCETSSGVYRAYNLNITGGGTMNWDNVIASNADLTAGDFVGIIERYSAFFSEYEYYGVMTSTVGLIVSRMNYLGAPTYTGTGARLDEFVYNAPGVNITANGISFLNIGAGYDEGLHIFATDLNSGTPAPYLAQAYFSGQSGCNIPSFHFTSNSGVCTPTAVTTLSPNPGLTLCNAIYILDANYSSKTNNCGPNSSVANGSNLRSTGIYEPSEISGNSLNIFTNPQESSLLISCKNPEEITSASISNSLGQKVFEYSKSSKENVNQNQILIKNLNLQTGTYILTIKSATGTQTKKFMYSIE